MNFAPLGAFVVAAGVVISGQAATGQNPKSVEAAPITPPAVEPNVGAVTNKMETFKGELRAGMVAIGGESTGFVLKTDKARLELSPKGNAEEIRKRLTELDGKRVVVTGVLTIRKGVERPTRQIVVVESVKAAE